MTGQLTKAEHDALDALVSKIDWSNPADENKRALATKIVEAVNEDIYTQQLVDIVADTRMFGPGEELQFRTTAGLVAYVIEPGSYAPRSQVTNTVTTLPKKLITVATELELNQIRSGRYGSIADLKREAAEQILGAQNQMLWDVAWRAVSSGSTDSNYASFASGATTATKKAALDTAIGHLEDYTNAGAKAIIGRYSALSFLEDAYLDTDYLPESMKEELHRRVGFMGTYRGVPVFHLKSFKDNYGVEKISASHIMVMGDGTLKFGIQEPGLEVFEQVKGTTTHTWEMAFWYTCGALATESKKSYHLEIV